MEKDKKVFQLSQLPQLAQEAQREGVRWVLTNGCFDILHVGHLRYLQQAKALGDRLFVAINSDASVRALKGDKDPRRPINPAKERAEIIAGLACVDGVAIFEDQRVTEVIKLLRPAIYTKGGDYTVESLNQQERVALEGVGTTIEILPLVPGRSTTKVIEKLS